MTRLTDTSIRGLPLPPKGQKTHWDDALTGFGCRVSQGGTRSFVLQYGPNRQLITIGKYHPDILPLGKARQEAKRLLAEAVLGKHRPHSMNFDDAKAAFLTACTQKNKPRTVYDYTRLMKRHLTFGRTQLTEISTADLTSKLARVKSGSERNYATTVAKIFFNWCYRQGYLETSPAGRLQTRPAPARARILTDQELAKVLKQALAGTSAFDGIVSLLILCGQRRSETAALEWDWINGDVITLPGRITKNGRDHTFPIGALAQKILAKIPHLSTYVFPAGKKQTEHTTVFNGWGKPKDLFDAKLKIAHYTLHDLRRTLRSKWAELGITRDVAEKYINHVSGVHSGVNAIYDRYSYLPEMRAAVAKWEDHLQSLLKV